MKKMWGVVAPLVVLVCLSSAQTKAPAGQTAVQAVTALERAYIEAGRQSDVAWYERYLADS